MKKIYIYYESMFTCCLPCWPVAIRSCQENPGKQLFPGPAASWEIACGPCEERAEGSVEYPGLRNPHLPVGSYLQGRGRRQIHWICRETTSKQNIENHREDKHVDRCCRDDGVDLRMYLNGQGLGQNYF